MSQNIRLTEGPRAGEFLLSEANGTLSREQVTIGSGANLVAGQVLGIVTATGRYVRLAPAASDGSQTAAGVLFARRNAATANLRGVAVVRDAEVNGNLLTWPAGITQAQRDAAVAQLAARGVIVRN